MKRRRRFKPIGHGESADVFPLDKQREPTKVIRVPKEREHKVTEGTPEREALNRYRRHQIAHALFPKNNLRVRGIFHEDKGMVSDFVHRPASNKRFSVQIRRGGRYEKVQETENPAILERAEEMKKAGLEPNLFEPNVMLKEGKPFFLEVEDLDEDKLRGYLKGVPGAKRKRVERLLERWGLEKSLDDLDLALYMSVPEERREIIERWRQSREK